MLDLGQTAKQYSNLFFRQAPDGLIFNIDERKVMDSIKDDFEEVTDTFAAHLKLNSMGDVVLKTKDEEIKIAWAKLDGRTQAVAKIKAVIRESHELEAEHAVG